MPISTAIPSIIPHYDALFRSVRIVPPYARHLTCRVKREETGMEIGDFLMRRLPFRSLSDWEQRLQDGLILQGDTVLRPGMQLLSEPPLVFFTPAQTEPSVPDEVAILEDTADYLLAYKPAPLPVHPGGRYNRNTLTSILQDLISNSAEPYDAEQIDIRNPVAGSQSKGYPKNIADFPEPAHQKNDRHKQNRRNKSNKSSKSNRSKTSLHNIKVLHRLDSVTSGLMLFGRTRSFSQRIRQAFADGDVEKSYLAVVTGTPNEDRTIINKPIRRKEGYVFECALSGKASITRFEVLIRGRSTDGGSLALVKCRPITGRTHQIRLHLREWGHPVIDDPLYGIQTDRTSGTNGYPMQNSGISLLHYALHIPRMGLSFNLADYTSILEVPATVTD